MDIQPQSTQPISDDQELAKVLAGVSTSAQDADAAAAAASAPALPPVPPAQPDEAAIPDVAAPLPEPAPLSAPEPALPAASGDLDGVKLDAINELRPLVDKLNISPEEKFDTYLLLIRSTDDKTLVAPAHEAAKAIVDETRRAQALLDIIKEIDFLAGPKQ